MDYDVGRVAAIQSAYLGIIKAFMPRYRAGRPTVVMLPGGMGSQLDRSPEPYRGEPPDFNRYDTVWIDLGLIFSSDGLALEIDAHGRDRDGYIVVPNGELRFLVDAYGRPTAASTTSSSATTGAARSRSAPAIWSSFSRTCASRSSGSTARTRWRTPRCSRIARAGWWRRCSCTVSATRCPGSAG